MATPNVSREHVAAAVRDGEIWAIAGRWSGVMHSSTEIYDPEAGSWRDGPTLIEARSGFGAVAVGDTSSSPGERFSGPTGHSLELLDDGDWVEGEPIPCGLHGDPLVALEGRLYLPGGSTRAPDP